MTIPRLHLITLLLIAFVSACSSHRVTREGAVLATSVREVQPLNDRDHFVYVWQRLVDGRRTADGVHVEHVSALAADNEFEIAISEDGVPSGRLRVRHTADAIALLEEDDLSQGVRMSYSPALPHLRAPVTVGEQEVHAIAEITRLDSGDPISVIDVRQRIRVEDVGRIESALGSYERSVSIRTNRTLQTAAGPVELHSAVLLVPGIGEIRSEGTATAPELIASPGAEIPSVVTRRELACAIIAGRPIGDCSTVPEQLAELRRGEAD